MPRLLLFSIATRALACIQAPLSIISNIGSITLLEELPAIDSQITSAVGYLPDGFNESDLGVNSNTTIAGA